MQYLGHCDSPLGKILLLSDGTSLTNLWFDGQKYSPAHKDCAEADLPVFRETVRWLDLYFGGNIPDFMPPISLCGTAFQRLVWKLLLQIPCGKTTTYGELAVLAAQELGLGRMSAQAIGGAVGRNPVSILVPCHRVVGRDGSLTGYAGGLDRKKWLLELEAGSSPLADTRTP